MNLRTAIVGLIVLATIGLVVGTTIERNSEESHTETPAAAHSEGSGEARADGGETHGEFQPFGIDIEAVPFIVLAALASLAMAAAVWTRPRSLIILGVVALAMVLFAALDVREVIHQIDESRTGLAVLAGLVAALHLAAALLIAALARDDRPLTGPVGTMPA
jgi:hypothetical protein